MSDISIDKVVKNFKLIDEENTNINREEILDATLEEKLIETTQKFLAWRNMMTEFWNTSNEIQTALNDLKTIGDLLKNYKKQDKQI